MFIRNCLTEIAAHPVLTLCGPAKTIGLSRFKSLMPTVAIRFQKGRLPLRKPVLALSCLIDGSRLPRLFKFQILSEEYDDSKLQNRPPTIQRGTTSRNRCGAAGLLVLTLLFCLASTPSVNAELATPQEMANVSQNFVTRTPCRARETGLEMRTQLWVNHTSCSTTVYSWHGITMSHPGVMCWFRC